VDAPRHELLADARLAGHEQVLLVVGSQPAGALEGGAHVVSEAIAAGVPVLASRIPGNVGLLGDDYPGYFRVGDDRALSRLIDRARMDRAFLRSLGKAVKARRALVRPAAERRALRSLIAAIRDGPRFPDASDRKHSAPPKASSHGR